MATTEEILEERDLIRRCQAGDEAAWFELFKRYRRCTCWLVRRYLGDEGGNRDLVDEIADQVWASLGYHRGQQLRGYDPGRGRFNTFLAFRTWQTVAKDRVRRRRRRHVQAEPSPDDPEPVDPGPAVEPTDWRVAEFLAGLPEWEAAFCRAALIDPCGAEVVEALSRECYRKRLLRLRRKFLAFLDQL